LCRVIVWDMTCDSRYHNEAAALGVDLNTLYSAMLADAEVCHDVIQPYMILI
jgi:hypothetical protein